MGAERTVPAGSLRAPSAAFLGGVTGWWVWLLAGLLLTACQDVRFSYKGTTARPENRIALAAGASVSGRWVTPDLEIQYRVSTVADRLHITGDVVLAARLQTGYTAVDRLFVGLNLLDDDNLVLESLIFALSGHRQPLRSWHFERELAMPPGTSGLAFSYDGKVSEGGGGTDWEFWRGP